ncbi:MAG TPA: hypothetical protein DDZ89_09700 [Clostridiales bacterium]|nr:hypothetical protein [Clostridiales bacterium]
MKKNVLGKDGVTLMELLIVISLMLLVMGLGYSLYFYAQKSFSNYEARWIVQNEARSISRYLEDQLDTIYQLEILDSNPVSFDDEYAYLWNEDNQIHIRYIDDDDEVVSTTLNHESDLTVEFIRGKDSKGNFINNFLQFQVVSNDVDYSVLNGVELRNLGKNMSIEGGNTGNSLKFKTVSLISELPEMDYSTFCVVATASYGSYQEPAVMLLRRFRDEFLNDFGLGRTFVRFYYNHSKPLSQVIARSGVLRLLTRILLYPLIAVAGMILNPVFRLYGFMYMNCMLIAYILLKKSTLSVLYGRMGNFSCKQ